MLPTQVPADHPKLAPITTGLEQGAFNTVIGRNILLSDDLIPLYCKATVAAVRKIIFGIILFSRSQLSAYTQSDCLNSNFKACREFFNKYGNQSDRAGAVELFEKACSAQTLHVPREIISVSKPENFKKNT